VTVPVCVFAFDLMFLDGTILLKHSFRERRALLRGQFPPHTPQGGKIARFSHIESYDSESGRPVFEEFWESAVASRSEGLMIKLLDNEESPPGDGGAKSRRKPLSATYDADKRTYSWMKLKKDYVTGLGDSLDLIPIGSWHGNGRKSQWWSPILLGVWNPDTNRVVAVCKCMSGFTDSFYKTLNERYTVMERTDSDSVTCSRSPLWGCDTGGLKPEVYFKPQEVWEIRGADITLSPVSVAALGLVSSAKGLSLRFPRFIRQREDKDIESASTPEFLANLWTAQQGKRANEDGNDAGDLVDVGLQGSDFEDDDN